MVSMSEKILSLKDSVSDTLIQTIEKLLINPIYINITQLSSRIELINDSLDLKITNSTNHLASRTLSLIRNLTSTLNSGLNSTVQQFNQLKNEIENNTLLIKNELQNDLNEEKKYLNQKIEIETNQIIKEINEFQNKTIPFIILDLKNWTNLVLNKNEYRLEFVKFLFTFILKLF